MMTDVEELSPGLLSSSIHLQMWNLLQKKSDIVGGFVNGENKFNVSDENYFIIAMSYRTETSPWFQNSDFFLYHFV